MTTARLKTADIILFIYNIILPVIPEMLMLKKIIC